VRPEVTLAERHAVAGKVDRPRPHPVCVADPQARQRPGLDSHMAHERERIPEVRVVLGEVAAVVALARLDDALARTGGRKTPPLPAADGLVQVQIVGGRRMLLGLARGRRRLQVPLVGGLDRVDRRLTVGRLEYVLDQTAVQREPARAAGSVVVEDVDAVAPDEVLCAQLRVLTALQLVVLTASVFEVLEQLSRSAGPSEGEARGAERG